MICISFCKGDYRDVKFPLEADYMVGSMPEMRLIIRQHKADNDYAIIYHEGESYIHDIILLRNKK